MRNSEYRFFLHFVRLPATFSLGYVSRHIQPAFLALFFRIRFIYCRLHDCRLAEVKSGHNGYVLSLECQRFFLRLVLW